MSKPIKPTFDPNGPRILVARGALSRPKWERTVTATAYVKDDTVVLSRWATGDGTEWIVQVEEGYAEDLMLLLAGFVAARQAERRSAEASATLRRALGLEANA